MNRAEKRAALDMEVHLWHCNDVRTWSYTSHLMLTVDLTKETVKTTVHHISINGDQYVDNQANLADLKQVYQEVHTYPIELAQHAPTVIADEQEAKHLINDEMLQLLKRRGRSKA